VEGWSQERSVSCTDTGTAEPGGSAIGTIDNWPHCSKRSEGAEVGAWKGMLGFREQPGPEQGLCLSGRDAGPRSSEEGFVLREDCEKM
jgi:hypothetical protein